MKIAGLLENNEIRNGMNTFLSKFDMQIAYDIENILKNVSNVINYTDIEAILIDGAARPKEQHKKLLYNIRAVLPNALLIWFCREKDRDEQFEAWAFSAVNLKNVIYINDKGEIPINRLVELLTDEHERLKAIEEAKKLGAENESKTVRDKQQKQRVVEKVVERPVIIEKEVIIDRPKVVKGLLKIAAFSVSSGAGSTAMALRLAEHLSKYGKVAVIEVDGSSSVQYAKAFSNCEFRVLKKSEELGDALYELYRSGFNITVTDYGNLFKVSTDGTINEKDETAVNRTLLKEFIKADVKIGMAFTSPWQIEKLKFFIPGNTVFEGLCGKAYEELCILTDGEASKAEKMLGNIKCFHREVDTDMLVQLLFPDIAAPKLKKHRLFNFLPKIQEVMGK